MQTHGTGNQRGSRLSAFPIVHTFAVDPTRMVSGTNYKLISFKVPASRPLLFRLNLTIAVAETATTATLNLGITAGGATWFAASDLKAAANTNYSPNGSGNWMNLLADTTFWAAVTRTGTPLATARAYLVFEVIEANVKSPGRAV